MTQSLLTKEELKTLSYPEIIIYTRMLNHAILEADRERWSRLDEKNKRYITELPLQLMEKAALDKLTSKTN